MFTQQQVWQGIETLARRKGLTVSRLARCAGLDATALNRSKRSNPDGQPRWPSTQTLSRLLSATNTNLADFARLIEQPSRDRIEHGGAARRDIVIVDDDRTSRDGVAAILRAGGYTVHLAAEHHLALDLLESDAVGLLCTDVVMPDALGGLALARRAALRRPELHILFITGYDLPMSAFHAFGSVLRKPVAADLLLAQVGRLLAGAAETPTGGQAGAGGGPGRPTLIP